MLLVSLLVLLFVLLPDHLVWSLVPKPREQQDDRNIWFPVQQPLQIVQTQYQCYVLDDAVKRFAECLWQVPPAARITGVQPSSTVVRTLSISTAVPCDESQGVVWPSSTMNETYSVDVSPNGIAITAQEVWGALHGLETVIQLFHRTQTNQLVISRQTINDGPRFRHRGYLIDTGRHFLPVSYIKQFLDAMAMVKMNVLHWHIVDTESFPYVSRTFPNLHAKGAYDPQLLIYTKDDVSEVLHHARKRAIRVMVEFDTPGHAESWGQGYPELLTECFTGKHRYGPMNPARKSTYEFLLTFFREVLSVFPDDWMHLGGDEVDFGCWKSNPEINAFMKEHQFGANYTRLQSYFTEQVLQLVQYAKPENRSIRPVVWQEVLDNGFNVHNETVIHIWKGGDWKGEIKRATSAGYNVLFSSCWYLNVISYGIDWPQYYDCDPGNFQGTEEEVGRVLGGEAAMWGEYVDETNLFSRSWPRGAAVAERLWSSGQLSHEEFKPRLNELRCQMVRRGWNAEPANGQGFCPQ